MSGLCCLWGLSVNLPCRNLAADLLFRCFSLCFACTRFCGLWLCFALGFSFAGLKFGVVRLGPILKPAFVTTKAVSCGAVNVDRAAMITYFIAFLQFLNRFFVGLCGLVRCLHNALRCALGFAALFLALLCTICPMGGQMTLSPSANVTFPNVVICQLHQRFPTPAKASMARLRPKARSMIGEG